MWTNHKKSKSTDERDKVRSMSSDDLVREEQEAVVSPHRKDSSLLRTGSIEESKGLLRATNVDESEEEISLESDSYTNGKHSKDDSDAHMRTPNKNNVLTSPNKQTPQSGIVRRLMTGLSSTNLDKDSPKRETEKQLVRRIHNLQEEQRLSDNFKRALKETLESQIEFLKMEMELEKDKVKRLESDLEEMRKQDQLTKMWIKDLREEENLLVDDNTDSQDLVLKKLSKQISKEKSKWQSLLQQKDTKAAQAKEIETNIKNYVAKLKEEKLFLEQLKEEKMFMDQLSYLPPQTEDVAANQSPEQSVEQLALKISRIEQGMSKLTEQINNERKKLQQIAPSSSGPSLKESSEIEIDLENHIVLMEEGVKAIKQAGEDKRKLNEAVMNLNLQLIDRQSQVDKLLKDIDTQKDFASKLEANIQAQKKQLEENFNSIEELKTSSEKKVQNLNHINEQLTQKLDEQAKEFEKLSKEQQAEKQQIQEQLQVVQANVTQVEAEKKSLLQQLQQMEVLQQEHEVALRSIEELQKQSKADKAKLIAAEEQVQQLLLLQKDLEQLTAEKQIMKDSYDKQMAELSKLLEDEKKSVELLTKEIDLYREKGAETDKEFHHQIDDLKLEYSKQLDAERDNITQLQQQISEQKYIEEQHNKKIEELQSKISDLQDLLTKAQEEIVAFQAQVEAAEKRHVEIQSQPETNSVATQADPHPQPHSVKNAPHTPPTEKVNQTEHTSVETEALKAFQSEIATLKSELAKSAAEVRSQYSNNIELLSALANTKEQLELERGTKNRLQTKLSDLNAEFESVKKQYQDVAQQSAAYYERLVTDLKTQLTHTTTSYEQQITSLKHEVEELTSKVAAEVVAKRELETQLENSQQMQQQLQRVNSTTHDSGEKKSAEELEADNVLLRQKLLQVTEQNIKLIEQLEPSTPNSKKVLEMQHELQVLREWKKKSEDFIFELETLKKESSKKTEYYKNVVLRVLSTPDEEREKLIPVVASMFQLTDAEVSHLKDGFKKNTGSGLFHLYNRNPPAKASTTTSKPQATTK